MNAAIQIFDFDLTWKGMLDSVVSLTHRTSWHEMPVSDLKVSVAAAGAEELQIGRVLVVNNQTNKALIIEDITRNLNEPYLEISCISLKGLLNWRICNPNDYTGATGKKQSEFMMNIPFINLVQQTRDVTRKFWNSAGAAGGKNMFGVTGIKAFGDTIDFTIDWKTGYMGDAVVAISKMYSSGGHPIGWNIYINNTWNQFVMDTFQATNRSINQTAYSPVVFSEDFGNIKNATYNKSNKDWRNVTYMNWNDGTTDKNTGVVNPLYGTATGFNRKEIIIDSSKKTSSEVISEGNSELNKRLLVESFQAEIINNPNTMSTYQVNWGLGDIVTIQSSALQVSVDAQITEIVETYADGSYTLEATFNEGQPNLIQLIKNEIGRRK
jgi:hypothetical protein